MKNLFLSISLIFQSSIYLYAVCPKSNIPGIHIVQEKETLYGISVKYNTTVQNLRIWNNLTDKDVLALCMELIVAKPNENPPNTPEKVKEYDIILPKKDISKATGSINGVSYFPQPGMAHLVMRGQSIKGIAELYGYTEEKFREFNGLINGEEVAEGTVLRSKEFLDDRYKDVTEVTQKETVAEIPKTETPKTIDPVPVEKTPPTETTPQSPPINTPPPAIVQSGMTPKETAMLEEVNLLRGNPSGYIQYVEKYVEDMKNGGSQLGRTYKTAKGLIKELKDTKPLSILQAKDCIYQAAKSHGEEEKALGKTGHYGKDGSMPWDRITKACDDIKDGNENLVGGREDVREAVIMLLIDDGIDDHGHRTTLLNPDWRYAAYYYVGEVGSMPHCWVQNFGF